MEQFLIYIETENYLAQWFVNHCGGTNPVQIERGSAESDILELFLSRRKYEIPDTGEHANLEIIIPWYKSKDIRYYNYLPPYGKKALEKTIYNKFRVQLWNDLNTVDNSGCKITDLIYAWMEKYGIEPDEKNWETIRQMYFRMRQKNYKKSLRLQNEKNTK